jgi:O-antigen ligase
MAGVFLPLIFYLSKHSNSIIILGLSKILLPVTVAIVVATFSRMGFLMLVIFFLWLLPKSKGLPQKMIAVAAFLLMANVIIGEAYKSRIMTIKTGEQFGRKYLWATALNIIQDYPLLGVGFGQVDASLYAKYSVLSNDPFLEKKEGQGGVHNGFLLIATEFGIPFLAVFIFLFFILIKDLRRMKKYFKSKNNFKHKHLCDSLLISTLIYLVGLLFTHETINSYLLLMIGVTILVKNNLIDSEYNATYTVST